LSAIKRLPPQSFEQPAEIIRQRRFEPHLASIDGMPEREAISVQRLPWKRNGPQCVRAVDVPALAHQGMAAQARLNPDLIPLPCLKLHLEERRVAELLDDAVVAHRFRALRIPRMRALLNQRLAIPDEVIAPRAIAGLGMAVDEREVDALRLAVNELLLQCLLRPRVLGKHHEPRGIAINPVNDKWAPPLRPKVTLEMTVDGRLVLLARKRHRQQPRRLVQHQQVAVFVEDIEMNFQGASASATARSGEVVRPSADAALKASGDSSVSSFAV
jgi:hypothetical protein